MNSSLVPLCVENIEKVNLNHFCWITTCFKVAVITTNKMEEEDGRRFQRNQGRFGIRTNKTLKYNKYEVESRRTENSDAIIVIDPDEDLSRTINGRLLLGISLNARKNWEIIENNNRNSLKSSQDDLDVDYGPRIVMIEDKTNGSQPTRWKDYSHQIYGSRSDEKEKENEPEAETISGTNRKGFFVKQKRKNGKKGVLKPESKGNRGRSKSFNNKSDSSCSESDSDSAIDEPEKDNRVILALTKPKHPDFVRTVDWDDTRRYRNHKNPRIEERREIVRNIDDL